MSNRLREIFTKDYSGLIKKWEQEYRETRDCLGCKHCIDLSDTYNTYHECAYGGRLPNERTCLLWEDKDES